MMALAAGPGCASGNPSESNGKQRVVTNLYVLEWLTDRLTDGTPIQVENLVPPGAEPHDAELTSKDTIDLADADLAVVLTGIQPALDDALGSVRSAPTFDAAEYADLVTPTGDGQTNEAEKDPHFWLDPVRLEQVATALAGELSERAPDSADQIATNADRLEAELQTLDADYESGLSNCRSTALVTSHTAFTYLADRYGFDRLGLSGLDPTAEPNQRELADLVSALRQGGKVTTVYYEPASGPALAEMVAPELNAETAPLDPIEVAPTETGPDQMTPDQVIATMRDNLSTLKKGQGCG
jgi:zinc transport system substrate-binding protein